MIAHLKGREQALEAFGWTGAKAKWIALASLHSSVFTRAQAMRFLDAHPEQVWRVVHGLIAQSLAAEETVPGVRGIGRVCRIFSRRVYRALGAEHIRHRQDASNEMLMRRLLSLDYLIEHADLPWLPTENEKVSAFEAARHRAPGPARARLPGSRREHPPPLPRQAARRARFRTRDVFVYADPSHDTTTALRSWGNAHRGLWRALTRLGRSVEVVAVARRSRETGRAERVMRGWAEDGVSAEADAGMRDEIARIERAILQGAVRVLEEFGGLQAAMKRSVELTKRIRSQGGRGSIHRGTAWRAVRLAGARYR